jgi:hypothetical protein
MGGGGRYEVFGVGVELLEVILIISIQLLPPHSQLGQRRTKPIPFFCLFCSSRSAPVPFNHLLSSPSSSHNIGNPPTSLGKLCTYPQYLPSSPSRISWSSIRARVGTVRFVVAVFAQSPLAVGSIRSFGSFSDVVRADRMAVLGTLSTIISPSWT